MVVRSASMLKRVVSVSGGKDSTATAILAIDQANVDGADVVLAFCDTGNEHELTLEHVHEYLPRALGRPITTLRVNFDERMAGKRKFIEENWLEHGIPADRVQRALEILQPTGNPFLDLCLWKGRFPSRMVQFCTQELKRRPLDDLMLRELEAGHELESWRGIRRDESMARRDAKAREMSAEGWLIVHPIVEWTAQQTIDFVRSRGIEHNPLYSQGMQRVGCMPCINCSKDELLEIAARFPHHVARIREWEQLVAFAAKRGASSFFTEKAKISSTFVHGWQHIPTEGDVAEHWVEPPMETMRRCSVDQRIEWAKTSRGGSQYDLLRSEMPPAACSSIYGLCE